MKAHGTRQMPSAVVTGLALAVLALGFLAALAARSLVVETASADPDPPNPGHSWSEIGDLPGTMWHSNNDGSGSGLDADTLDGLDSNQIQDADDYVSDAAHATAADDADTVDGQHASSFAPISHDHDGTYWAVAGNSGTGGSDFLGTVDDQALELRVNNVRALRLEPEPILNTGPNVVGGHSGNVVRPGVSSAAICGGGTSDDGFGNYSPNQVSDHGGTVGGGVDNEAGSDDGVLDNSRGATVAGGSHNAASGQASTISGGNSNRASGLVATVGGGAANQAAAESATVAGGALNRASGLAATVGGGGYNTADGGHSFIGGGVNNVASGSMATVPGGQANAALGDSSFAAGTGAKANSQGCFVWGDATLADVACNDVNRFIARASGGVYLYTSADLSTGSYLAAGSGSWSSVSDRNVKANFSSVDGREVLAGLAEVPIATWNYKAQDDSVRHMGPVAQDFYAAFGLGEGNTAISTVDADGVALAAIQGLDELAQEQAARIEVLEEENAALHQQLDDLEARVSALEDGTSAMGVASSSFSASLPVRWLVPGGLVLALAGLALAARRLAANAR